MNKKGFTLIELLAVIIILGILMIIAIPSVTKYISDSRKNAYVDTAKEIVGGARNLVNEGKLEMYDTNTTYYINSECIKTENASKSPYGDFTKAYVVVTYNGKGYDYYWTSVDDAGQGIKKITKLENLDIDSIESDLTTDDIKDTLGIDGRSKYVIINKQQTNCRKGVSTNVTGKVSGSTGEEVNPICKRATSLHTSICTKNSGGCYNAGYHVGGVKNTTTITYGVIWNGTGEIPSGAAFDCDVNNDGVYDSNTERFYYVSREYVGETNTFDDTKAVLVYFHNVDNGTTLVGKTGQTPGKGAGPGYTPYYSSVNENWHGPVAAIELLPTTSQWKNNQIIVPSQGRTIIMSNGGTSISGHQIEEFFYQGKAARFLTYQEIVKACGTVSTHSDGYLDSCNYLMENLGLYEGSTGTYAYWLETPADTSTNVAWIIQSNFRTLSYGTTTIIDNYGVRPAITIKTSDLS